MRSTYPPELARLTPEQRAIMLRLGNPLQPPLAASAEGSDGEGNYDGGSDLAVVSDDGSDGEGTPATGALSMAAAPGDAAAALQQGLAAGRTSIADMYKQITENIEKRYRAPSFNDMLIAIGTGMMSSPGENDSGGFGGAVQRGLRGIGTYAQKRNERRDALNDLMTKVDIQKVQDLAGLESKYVTGAASLLRGQRLPSVIMDNGRAYEPSTGVQITPPGATAWQALAAEPTVENYNNFVKQFGPRFAEEAARIVRSGQR